MADITHGTWIKGGKAVDAVYQNGVKAYGRNLFSVRDWNAKPDLVSNFIPYMNIQLEPNTAYTLTTNISRNGDGWSDVFLFKDNETPATPTSGADSVSGRTLTTSSTGNVKVGMRNYSVSDGTNWIKLEKGTIATPWSPAPEDVLK
ncbi:host range and adsorption protein [Lactobacillus phage 521B]|uniref:Structural protein n=1 Tax=Lactobacillus phage 521B TaxID=2510942 RepID=A0A4Y5FEK8_9CAUD|nr:host range and adsorption protein [Lactobacillus phage 521B]QBJ03456.1 structural protein [Lactobacillus phage 521B]